MPEAFKDRIPEYTARVGERLDAALPLLAQKPTRLHEAMRYAVLNGGKRVRPLLVYAVGECLNIDRKLLDAPAVAIELIHAFSLVHDDLPAMDNDDLRRGKPTVHKQFDEATAILAADALQPLAFSVLADLEHAPGNAAIDLIRLVSSACGSIGMTGGQSIDLDAEGKMLSADELEHMYSLKTGALIHAAIISPAYLSTNIDSAAFNALDRFGRIVGVLFQLKDDILDVEGETEVIGKPAGSDVSLNKATYPALFGLKESKRRCEQLLSDALRQIECFDGAGEALSWLARFIVTRGR